MNSLNPQMVHLRKKSYNETRFDYISVGYHITDKREKHW